MTTFTRKKVKVESGSNLEILSTPNAVDALLHLILSTPNAVDACSQIAMLNKSGQAKLNPGKRAVVS